MGKSDATTKKTNTLVDAQDVIQTGAVSKPAQTSCDDIARRFGKIIVEKKKKKRPAGW